MAKRLAVPSKELQLTIVGPRDVFKASRIQKLSMNTDIPVENKDELGNRLHVGTSKDTPTVTLTFQAFDVGIKVFATLTGKDPAAYPASPTGSNISLLGEVDAIIAVKDAVVEDYVKSAHARRLQIRDFAYNYTVDGDSTEDYTAIGSEKRWLKYDVICDKFVNVGGFANTLTQTPVPLKNGRNALSVILDGVYLTEADLPLSAGEYNVAGTALTTFEAIVTQCIAIYHAQPIGTNWLDVSDAVMPAAIRGKDVDISISANEIARVQSVTVNGNLNPQAVKELGNRNVVGYQRQVPTIEGTVTVLDTDTELISLLTDGVLSGVANDWQPGEGCTTSGISLKIELVDPCDVTGLPTVLKTVYLPSIEIVGDSYTSNVNNNATQSFNYRSSDAQLFVYSGAM